MTIRTKAILFLIGLGILDLISVFFPVTAAFGIYVVLKRPEWFTKVLNDIYNIG